MIWPGASGMTSTGAKTAFVIFALCLSSGCGDSSDSDQVRAVPSGSEELSAQPTPSPDDVPPEFQSACGKPGSTVEVERKSVTVAHSACDLTGVILTRQGSGVAVPPPGLSGGSSGGVTISVDPVTNDVTFSSEA